MARPGARPLPAVVLEIMRKDKPYQLEDRVEQLFHEKSITGRGAWNRLFDETMASLRFDVDGEELTLEPTLNRLQDADEDMRARRVRSARRDLQGKSAPFHSITNTLAKDKEISDRWRGFKDIADSRHLANRVERRSSTRSPPPCARPIRACRTATTRLKASWLGRDQLNHWDRNAPLPETPTRTIGWDEARATVLGAYGRFSPDMAEIARSFFDRTGSTRRCGPARRRAPSRTRPCRRRIPTCCSTTWASRAT